MNDKRNHISIALLIAGCVGAVVITAPDSCRPRQVDNRPLPLRDGVCTPATFWGRDVISLDCAYLGSMWRCNKVLDHCSRRERIGSGR